MTMQAAVEVAGGVPGAEALDGNGAVVTVKTEPGWNHHVPVDDGGDNDVEMFDDDDDDDVEIVEMAGKVETVATELGKEVDGIMMQIGVPASTSVLLVFVFFFCLSLSVVLACALSFSPSRVHTLSYHVGTLIVVERTLSYPPYLSIYIKASNSLFIQSMRATRPIIPRTAIAIPAIVWSARRVRRNVVNGGLILSSACPL